MSGFKVLEVDEDGLKISDVAESAGVDIPKGGAYYLLVKSESVSASKKIVAINKKTKKEYSDDDAREAIGADGTKWTPKQFAAFDVYIQTTSANRKLAEGQKVLIATGGGKKKKAEEKSTKKKSKGSDDDNDEGSMDEEDDEEKKPAKKVAAKKATTKKPVAAAKTKGKRKRGSDDDDDDDDEEKDDDNSDDEDEKPAVKKGRKETKTASSSSGNGVGVYGDYVTLTAKSDGEISDVASQYDVSIGSGYYELAKTESVSASKSIVIINRDDDSYQSGSEARKTIKLKGTAKIKPAQYPDWAVFIQSTSANRGIKKGQRILYEGAPPAGSSSSSSSKKEEKKEKKAAQNASDEEDDTPKSTTKKSTTKKAAVKAPAAAKKKAVAKSKKTSDDDNSDDNDDGSDDEQESKKKKKTVKKADSDNDDDSNDSNGNGVTRHLVVLEAKDSGTIQDVADSYGAIVGKGEGFYELTKAEQVSATKKLIAINRENGAGYFDAEARKLLKLKAAKKIKPNDFPDHRVFIQSTSANRSISKGDHIVYEGDAPKEGTYE